MRIGVKVENGQLILDNLGEFAQESLIDILWMANHLGKNGISPEYYDDEVNATTLAEIELGKPISGVKIARKIIRIWETKKLFVLL